MYFTWVFKFPISFLIQRHVSTKNRFRTDCAASGCCPSLAELLLKVINVTVVQKHCQSSVPANHNSEITELFSLTANQTLQSSRPFPLRQLKNTQLQRGKCTAPHPHRPPPPYLQFHWVMYPINPCQEQMYRNTFCIGCGHSISPFSFT